MAWFRKKREKSLDGTMTLMEHLYELRRRLMWAVIVIVLGAIIGFVWFEHGIPAIRLKDLNDVLLDPYCTARLQAGYEDCTLIALAPFSGLTFQLQAAIMAGLVFSSPGWLYQIWAFVTPALYSKERRYAVTFVSLAALMFVLGAFLAYLVIPEGLKVLFSFGGDNVRFELTPDTYYGFLMTLLIVFGLSFELPLFLIALNMIGVLKGRQLAKWRRYAIFAMFVFAALVVPGNDPITMLALALSLSILYEISVQFSKFNDKRRGREVETFENLSDDEASAI